MNRQHSGSLVAFLVVSLQLSLGSVASADVVTDWNTAALKTIRALKAPPPLASRALAILHLSIFDAVNGIARTHVPYALSAESAVYNVPASASRAAAASAAAHRTLVALFPADASGFDDLHDTILAALKDGPQKNEGIVWGELVADRILAARGNDGAGASVAPPYGDGPGAWQPTPPGFAVYLSPQWGFVTPFTMPGSCQFRPVGPPSLGSAQYADAYNEVKAFGAATGSVRTPDQQQVALFWADGGGTETPPGHWNSIAQGVAAAHGNTLAQNARLFGLLNAAMADAAICAWDAKYVFNFWRPVTAIQNGDADGNSATAGDAAWTSFIVTPPFPAYTSGHSTFSGAAAKVLELFYGTDNIAFTTDSDVLPGVTRSFASFSPAA